MLPADNVFEGIQELRFSISLLFFHSLFSISGGFDDYVEGDDGMDLVFGDHGEIILSKDNPYKLVYATTTDASCTPGADNITLGKGDDLAFGGTELLQLSM